DTLVVSIGQDPLEEAPCGRAIRIDLEPRVNEWTDQPRPHGALMIGAVAGASVAIVARLIVLFPGASDRRPTGVNKRSGTASSARFQGPESSRGCRNEIASTWFGRHDGSSPSSPSTTS